MAGKLWNSIGESTGFCILIAKKTAWHNYINKHTNNKLFLQDSSFLTHIPFTRRV